MPPPREGSPHGLGSSASSQVGDLREAVASRPVAATFRREHSHQEVAANRIRLRGLMARDSRYEYSLRELAAMVQGLIGFQLGLRPRRRALCQREPDMCTHFWSLLPTGLPERDSAGASRHPLADKRSRKGMGSTDRVRSGRLGERTPLSILRPSISFNGWHGSQPRGAGCRWDHGDSSLCTCERLAARGEPLSCLPSLPIPS